MGSPAADVTAKDDIVDTARLVNSVRDNTSGHWELDWCGVDNTDNVSGAGRLQNAEEGPVTTVFRVKFDDLLVVVRTLKELNPRVEGPAVGLQKHLNAFDCRVERISAESTALDGRLGLQGFR